jgi:HEAT repeat protein
MPAYARLNRGRTAPGSRTRRILPLAAATLLLAGCNSPTMRMGPEERIELRRRATGLLLRAAQSKLDVVCCNALEALADIAPQEGLAYFHAALESELAMVRFAGCVALGEVRDTTSRGGIRRCLTDPDPRVRLGAAYAAYRLGETSHAEVLVNALHDSPDENLRADAAYLIGRLGEPRALKRLRYKAQDKREKAQKVTIQVQAAMAMLGDRAALDQLMRYAHYDALSRVIALQCLCDAADPRARDTLLYRLHAEDEYLEAKLIAARALGKIGSDAGYELAAKSTTYTADDPQDVMRVRSLAALALGAIGDERALPWLKRLAESEPDARIQVAACYAIRQILTEPAAP